jgi:glutathione S-transferase
MHLTRAAISQECRSGPITRKRMTEKLKIYGDLNSGNCLKVKWVCDKLSRRYTWIDIDTMKGESRTPEFLRLNGAGQVPVVELDDGRTLAQSNAIIRYLARGTDLIPAEAFLSAKMDEWLFWEQYSHEPYIAVCRFMMFYLGKSQGDLDPEKVKRGYFALARMDRISFTTRAFSHFSSGPCAKRPGWTPQSLADAPSAARIARRSARPSSSSRST